MSSCRGPRLLRGTRTTRHVAPRHKKPESRQSRPAGFRSCRPCAGSLHNGQAPGRAGSILHGNRGRMRPPQACRPYLRRSACRTRRRNRHWEIAEARARWPAVWDKAPAENLCPALDEEWASPFGQMPRARRPVPASGPRQELCVREQSRPFAGVFPLRMLGKGERSANKQKTSVPARIPSPLADDWQIRALGAFRDYRADG